MPAVVQEHTVNWVLSVRMDLVPSCANHTANSHFQKFRGCAHSAWIKNRTTPPKSTHQRPVNNQSTTHLASRLTTCRRCDCTFVLVNLITRLGLLQVTTDQSMHIFMRNMITAVCLLGDPCIDIYRRCGSSSYGKFQSNFLSGARRSNLHPVQRADPPSLEFEISQRANIIQIRIKDPLPPLEYNSLILQTYPIRYMMMVILLFPQAVPCMHATPTTASVSSMRYD